MQTKLELDEIWTKLVGYEKYYLISPLGEVKRIESKRNIAKSVKTNGYVMLSLCVKRKTTTHTLHTLLARTFVSNPHNKPMVNHIDGNRLNNTIENLEWVTSRENTIHAIELKRSAGYVFPHYPSKIKEGDYEIIMAMLKSGMSRAKIAEHFKTSRQSIIRAIKKVQEA